MEIINFLHALIRKGFFGCQTVVNFDWILIKNPLFHTDNVVVDEIDKIDALTMATDEISRKGSKNIFSLIKEDGR